MGLLDSMLGAALKGTGPTGAGGAADALGALLGQGGEGAGKLAALLPVLQGLLANDGPMGGLGGLVQKFNQAGLGEIIGSWIGKGENLPISAQQIRDVLGNEQVGQLAGQVGLDPAQLSESVSQLLPGLVDQLTPDGAAPLGGLGDSGALRARLSGLLLPR